MKKHWRLLVAIGLAIVLLIFHIVVDRRSTMKIVVDGEPTRQSMARIDNAITISPDSDGVFNRPRGVHSPSLPFVFSNGKDSNYFFAFPNVGQKIIELNGDEILVFERMTYLWFYSVEKRVEQK